MDVFEAMETCRAIRRLKPDPLPEEDLRRLVFAATRASNPGNSQGWVFVVLRDPEAKARIGAALRERMGPVIGQMTATETDASALRMYAGVQHLLDHYEQVPAWVFVCGRLVYPPQAPSRRMLLASVYPAAQNLVVAARALGYGTTFTTFHETVEPVVRETLALPGDVELGVAIAVGRPDAPFGPVRRRPLDEVLHWDRWGGARE